jgi:hypothetical protein
MVNQTQPAQIVRLDGLCRLRRIHDVQSLAIDNFADESRTGSAQDVPADERRNQG